MFFPLIVSFVLRSQLIDFSIVNLIPDLIIGSGASIMISLCGYLACMMKGERKELWRHGSQFTNIRTSIMTRYLRIQQEFVKIVTLHQYTPLILSALKYARKESLVIHGKKSMKRD